MTNNTRGSVNPKVGAFFGIMLLINITVLVTSLTLGIAWKIISWLIPGLGGC